MSVHHNTVHTEMDDDDGDDESGVSVAALAGGIVATFIITLVVTLLVSVIITRMYYKYWSELKRKSNIATSDLRSTQQDTIKMDTNPAYDTAPMATEGIKMDTNPAYAVAK